MAFTKEDKVLINVLRQERGFGAKRLLKEFPNWSVNSLNKLLQKIDRIGSVDRKPGSGKTRKARTARNVVDSVEELVLSQEDAPGTRRTIRQISVYIKLINLLRHNSRLRENFQHFTGVLV